MGVQRTPKGFAVVDFETTGINPMGGDRAIEVGIVHVAPDGTLEDEAETLIRVQRDLGAQNLHHGMAAYRGAAASVGAAPEPCRAPPGLTVPEPFAVGQPRCGAVSAP